MRSPAAPFPPAQVKWFSPFLLAVWDPVREEFQSLCRCMSGFSDQFYAAAKERLGATIIPGVGSAIVVLAHKRSLSFMPCGEQPGAAGREPQLETATCNPSPRHIRTYAM